MIWSILLSELPPLTGAGNSWNKDLAKGSAILSKFFSGLIEGNYYCYFVVILVSIFEFCLAIFIMSSLESELLLLIDLSRLPNRKLLISYEFTLDCGEWVAYRLLVDDFDLSESYEKFSY